MVVFVVGTTWCSGWCLGDDCRTTQTQTKGECEYFCCLLFGSVNSIQIQLFLIAKIEVRLLC